MKFPKVPEATQTGFLNCLPKSLIFRSWSLLSAMLAPCLSVGTEAKASPDSPFDESR